MFRPDVKAKIENELARGAAARAEGFEGRARVCARRAAGAAIRAYLDAHGQQAPGSSAYDLLAFLQKDTMVSEDTREAARHLLTRVDEDFLLPVDVDLLAEAARLAQALEASLSNDD